MSGETSDTYRREVMRCGKLRVIVCKNGLQWIIQRRKNGRVERRWVALHYCTTRKALIRLCVASELMSGDSRTAFLAALEALPENIRLFMEQSTLRPFERT